MRGMLRVWCRRRFCEDRRQRLSWLREEGSSFSAWWRTLAAERRKQLTTEKGESILKVCLRAHRAACRRAVVAREGKQLLHASLSSSLFVYGRCAGACRTAGWQTEQAV